MVTKLLAAAWLVLIVAMPVAALADVQVSVDRETVRLDESFTITFEYRGMAAGDPDLSKLEANFEVLATNRISSVQIDNGVATSLQSWQVSVMARRTGILVVPPIRFGADLSPPLNVRVLNAADAGAPADADIFVETSVEPDNGYVQAQLLYTIRLYRALQTSNSSLTEPNISGGDAVLRKLDKDTTYETTRDGRRFEVFERRYAVFPQQSGALTFEPIVFRGEFRDRNWRQKSRRASSEPVTVTIKPRPPGAGDPWLPASALELAESWPEDPPTLRAGESITRTLTLVADGLTAAQLPPLPADLPDGFRSYPDQPTLNDEQGPSGIIGFRQQKLALLPTRPGVFTLPEIRIPWFDVRTGRSEVARLPERQVEVLPALAQANSATADQADEAAQSLAPAPTPMTGKSADSASDSGGFWRAVSMALAVVWLATLAVVIPRLNAARVHAAPPPGAPLPLPAATLQQACQSGDASAAQRALLEWGRARWPKSPPQNLRDLGRRCPTDLADEIDALSSALYSATASGWDGQQLCRVVRMSGRVDRNQARPGAEPDAVLGRL